MSKIRIKQMIYLIWGCVALFIPLLGTISTKKTQLTLCLLNALTDTLVYVCVCMYIYIYIYIHTHTHVCVNLIRFNNNLNYV